MRFAFRCIDIRELETDARHALVVCLGGMA